MHLRDRAINVVRQPEEYCNTHVSSRFAYRAKTRLKVNSTSFARDAAGADDGVKPPRLP